MDESETQREMREEDAYEDAKADAAERIPFGSINLAAHKSDGKPRVGDLDPGFWLAMGKVMTQGLTKYPNDPDGMPNWWKGGSFREFCASIQRLIAWLTDGENLDPESGLPHAAHIAVDAMFLWSWITREVGQDDRLA